MLRAFSENGCLGERVKLNEFKQTRSGERCSGFIWRVIVRKKLFGESRTTEYMCFSELTWANNHSNPLVNVKSLFGRRFSLEIKMGKNENVNSDF